MKKIKFNKKHLEILSTSWFPFEDKVENKNIPDWLSIFVSAIEQYKRFPCSKGARPYDKKNSENMFFIIPFVRVALLEVSSVKGVFYKLLSDKCQFELESQLIEKLIYICSSTIATKYSDTSNISIEKYISELYRKPLDFYREYPVIAKLLAMHTQYWVQSTTQMLNRLLSDFTQYNERFFGETKQEQPQEIIRLFDGFQMGLSDPHEKGQTVVIIKFKHGKKLVYKPKSVMAEYAFSRLVDWVNEISNSKLKLKPITVINKNDYGWVEYIEYDACKNENEIYDFYTRVGMFSALLYMIRGMDYHHENLICNNGHPFFIDHEMLFYPIYIDPSNKDLIDKDLSEVQSGYYESVINTRLYPIVEKRVNGRTADVSAVGHISDSGENYHLPQKDCRLHNPCLYKKNILSGFKGIYRLLMENKKNLMAGQYPLKYFMESEFRFNIRSTSSYLSINNLCLASEALTTGVNFCNKIHSIRLSMQSVFSREPPFNLRVEELKILSRLDVPRFTVQPSSKYLYSSDAKALDEILKYSGIELVNQRIRDMSDADKDKQAGFIEKALCNS